MISINTSESFLRNSAFCMFPFTQKFVNIIHMQITTTFCNIYSKNYILFTSYIFIIYYTCLHFCKYMERVSITHFNFCPNRLFRDNNLDNLVALKSVFLSNLHCNIFNVPQEYIQNNDLIKYLYILNIIYALFQ